MNKIKEFFAGVYRAAVFEFKCAMKDKGILIFLFLVPLLYPIVYALIYNTEVSRDVPMVIVDEDRSALSRELGRLIDGSEAGMVAGYAADMEEAKAMVAEKKAYGIVYIDRDFSKTIERGESATVTLFMDMSLMIRYKSQLVSLTDATLDLGSKVQVEALSRLGADGPKIPTTVASYYYPVGNPEQGFGTFLLPGILVMIVQQTLLLSVCMMGGGMNERRRMLGGRNPLSSLNAGPVAIMLGKAVTYLCLYILPMVFLLLLVPYMFSYPQLGGLGDILQLVLPFILSTVFLGMVLQVFVSERETSFLVIVFTSIIFLFLSGLVWPVYDMPAWIRVMSACTPSSWAVPAFVRINSNGAVLSEVAGEYQMLWVLTAVYFLLAYGVNKLVPRGMFRKL